MENPNLDHLINGGVVYTTKLDSMTIFNYNRDLSNVDFQTIMDIVETESKPEFSRKRKLEHDLKFAKQENITYETLEKKVKFINKKSIERMKNNTTSLLALCKPLSIVLNDIKNRFKEPIKPKETLLRQVLLSKTELNQRFGAYLQYKDSRMVNTDDDDVIFVESSISNGKKTSLPKPSNKIQSSLKPKFAVIFDVKNSINYVYVVARKGLVIEYETFHAVTEEIAFVSSLQDAMNYRFMKEVRMPSCCWYNRVNTIQALKFCNTQTKDFMTIPHSCDPYECQCCCRKYKPRRKTEQLCYQTPSNYTDLTNYWLFNHIVRSSSPLSKFFIQTSPSHSIQPTSQLVKKPQLSQKEKMGVTSSIQIEDEFYELRADGHIIFFIKYMNNPEIVRTNVGPKLCCWYSRKQVVERLNEFETLPIHVNFLKTPHKCHFGACTCCCKPVNNNKEKLIFYSISQRFTGEIVKKRINMRIKFAKAPTESHTKVPTPKFQTISNNRILPKSTLATNTTPDMLRPKGITQSASTVPYPPANLIHSSRSSLPKLLPRMPPLRPFTSNATVRPVYRIAPIISTVKPANPANNMVTHNPSIPPLTTLSNQTNLTSSITTQILEKLKNIKLNNKDNPVSINIGVPLKQLGLVELKVIERLLESFSKSANKTDTEQTQYSQTGKLFMEMSYNAARKNRNLLRSFKQVNQDTKKTRSDDPRTEVDVNEASQESITDIRNSDFEESATLEYVKPGPSGMLRIRTPMEISQSNLAIM